MPPSRRALNCRNRERRLAASEETIRQEVSRCEFVRRVWPRRSRCAACRPQGGQRWCDLGRRNFARLSTGDRVAFPIAPESEPLWPVCQPCKAGSRIPCRDGTKCARQAVAWGPGEDFKDPYETARDRSRVSRSRRSHLCCGWQLRPHERGRWRLSGNRTG